MLNRPFAVSIRAALPVLLVFVFFFCPLVAWSVRGDGTLGVIAAVNRILQGTGLSVATGVAENTPGAHVFAVSVEPAEVVTRDGARLSVQHTLQVFGPDAWCTEPWMTGGEKGGAIGSMLCIGIDPPRMPAGGLAVRCNGVVWALNVTDEGPALGPVPASTPPPLEEVSLFGGEPPGTGHVLVWRRQEKWFNDEGANRLINTPALVLKRGYINTPELLALPRTGVFFTAGVTEDNSPLAGVTVVPLEEPSPWTHVTVAFAPEQGAAPLAMLTIPHPAPPDSPPPGPCVLDLLLDESGAGGRLLLTIIDRHTDWEVWWSSAGVEIVPAM